MNTDTELTESQLAAVEHFEGPLLVVAGPGSGKTRVITRRIARLIDRGIHPGEILAITFTNKSARVMSERVQDLLPRSFVWVSTFHRFCAKLLREHAAIAGLRASFSIYDVSDQLSLMKNVLRELDLDTTHFPPAKLLGRISKAKNELITPQQYSSRHSSLVGNHLDAVVARVYPVYQKQLLEANAVDFDDLLMHVANLLAENDELRRSLDERHRFILVDEYQDTNRAQYQIVAALSQQERNLCVTGDPDQSIYGWRGAQIENILKFEHDFRDATVVRLEENFRSTPEILATADELIRHNVMRKNKRLKPTRPNGEPVELRMFADGQHEATSIAAEIQSLVRSGRKSWNDFGIFYRTNSLSRSIETALSRLKVPHQVAGGLAFYERAEIKDVLGYLRLIENSQDRVAFMRVVNTPARGVGKSSLDRFIRWADQANIELLTAARNSEKVPNLSKKAAVGLRSFAALIQELAELSANPFGSQVDSTEFSFEEFEAEPAEVDATSRGPVETVLRAVLDRTGYYRQYEGALEEEEIQRKSNVDELISSAMLYDKQLAEREEVATLSGFLETASLAQDVDALEEDLGAVTLMTLHAAKGLEFRDVYVVGVEQNLLPHERSIRENNKQSLEEERRLLFVGITRAKERLVLTHTARREMHGRTLSTIPSDFLQELRLESRDFRTDDPAFGLQDHQFSLEDFEHDSQHASDDSLDFSDESHSGNLSSRRSVSKKTRKKKALEPSELHLTTGAALEAGASLQASLPIAFGVGMQVRHPRYGLGTIIEVSGLSRRRTLTVEFVIENRRETFVAAKCPLQPVGLG